jgi:hypothetical protein
VINTHKEVGNTRTIKQAGEKPKRTNPHRQLNNYKVNERRETRARDRARSKMDEDKGIAHELELPYMRE